MTLGIPLMPKTVRQTKPGQSGLCLVLDIVVGLEARLLERVHQALSPALSENAEGAEAGVMPHPQDRDVADQQQPVLQYRLK